MSATTFYNGTNTRAGMDPRYLARWDPVMQKFYEKHPGWCVKFLQEFVWMYGRHLYIVGTTGCGKTNAAAWIAQWLALGETVIWLSASKGNEILPLLCLGKKVRIICPTGHDVKIEERIEGEYQEIENHPEIVHVNSPSSVWHAIKGRERDSSGNYHHNTINIIEIRNAFDSKADLLQWTMEMFESLTRGARLGQLPATLFPCAIIADESAWFIAGTRVTRDGTRISVAEAVTENFLTMRSEKCRFVMISQSHANIDPSARENLICTMAMRGFNVDSNENPALAEHCGMRAKRQGRKPPHEFAVGEAKMIYPDGSAAPVVNPWVLSLMPKSQEDRDWVDRCRISYTGYYEKTREPGFTLDEFPDLGVFAPLVIQGEKKEVVTIPYDVRTMTLQEEES